MNVNEIGLLKEAQELDVFLSNSKIKKQIGRIFKIVSCYFNGMV